MQLNWPAPNEFPALRAGEVHVWAVPLAEVQTPWPELERLLSEEERERAGRFLREEAGRSCAAARAGLRSILGGYLRISPADVPIVTAPNGKPGLAAAANDILRFNLAHSGQLALVAVTRGGEIGVDVERLRQVNHRQDIASRYFHPIEVEIIGKDYERDAPQHSVAFFRCWTRKEAVLKAIGVGIIFPLDAFRVPLDEHVRSWVDVPAHSSMAAARYWLQSLAPGAGYIAALATTAATQPPQGFTYSL